MKKNILYLFAVLFLLASCLSDDSDEGDLASFQDVTVEGIESKYTITSYTGKHLQITPAIDTDIASDKLTYKWSIVEDKEIDVTTQSEIPFEVISNERNLDYEINLAPGSYILKYEVMTESGYTVTEKSTISVSTAFLNAYYVLKETADGNTDVDYYTSDGDMVEDALSRFTFDGSPMKGKPLYLSFGYNSCYYDDDAKQQINTLIYVSSEDGSFCGVRPTDFGVQVDRNNVCFQTIDDDEIPYGVCTNAWTEVFITNKGCRWTYSGDMSSGSGKFGAVDVPTGMSRHIINGAGDWYMYYWDEDYGTIYMIDYNGGVSQAYDENYMPIDYSDYTCVGSGASYLYGAAMFVLENKTTGERKIVTTSVYTGTYDICDIPSDCVAATSSNVSFSVNGGTIVYATDGNDVYVFDYASGSERKLTIAGLPSGTTITYVSNILYSGSAASVDYLCIGTESGGRYTASFYDTVGGAPDGAPVFQMQGTGKISGIGFVAPTYSLGADSYATVNCIAR